MNEIDLIHELIRDNESLRAKYAELQSDAKDLVSMIANLTQGKGLPLMLEFNDPDGYSAAAESMLRLWVETNWETIKGCKKS